MNRSVTILLILNEFSDKSSGHRYCINIIIKWTFSYYSKHI